MINLESILTDVRELTATNNHSLARLKIASEILKSSKLSKAYEAVETLNSFYGFLDPNVANIRNDLDLSLKTQVNFKFEASQASKILKCL